MIQVIVLAAGSSKRFTKGNKLLHNLNTGSILSQTLGNIRDAQLGPILLVTGFERESILDQVPIDLFYKEVFNPDHRLGMTGSIQSGVKACPNNTTGYMICLADQVQIKPSTYALLASIFTKQYEETKKVIVAPYFQNKRGNPILLSAHYREAILEVKDENGCKSILEANPNHIFNVPIDDPAIRIDIDRVEDLPD